MIRKRVHTLKYTEIVETNPYQDENGDWIEGETIEKVIELNCRADVNSGGRTIKNNDNKDYVFSFALFLDRIPDSLKRGTKIEVFNKNKRVVVGEVILPFDYQAHHQLWV
ncbi:hypothetical protein [Sphingobacterium sp. UBA6320]|uniref:hypothetical protein n=1 Tax=Sphingobacterium sp. UBA6320 TaxID=1947510 RepID=UPI0025CDDF55|nr:hypothetical protein [Sphingobacterium sp. UBA6320]